MGFGCPYPCLFRQFGSGGSNAKLCYLLPPWDITCSVVKSEVGNVVEAKIGGLILAAQVFKARWNLLRVSGFVAAVGKWGRQHRRSSLPDLLG
jgi:hypothetical protein